MIIFIVFQNITRFKFTLKKQKAAKLNFELPFTAL